MADKFVDIKFKSESDQGLEDFIAAQRVNFVLRKVAKTMKLSEVLTKDGDTYTYSFESTFKNHKMVFKLGEPCIDHGVDGRDMNVKSLHAHHKFYLKKK